MSIKLAILPVTPFQQNSSLIIDEATGEAALVDPGGDLDHLLAMAEKHGAKLTKILVTHAHIDHAGAVGELAERLNLPIEGPQREEQFWIDMLPAQAQQFGFPPAQAFTPTRWLEDGDTVSVGETEFNVIHCPGHTPGHIVFHQVEAKIAIVGDVLFQGSIGRTDFPRGNHAQLISSIRDKLFPLGDDISFVPGHGPTSTFGAERQTNPFVSDAAVGA